MSMKKWHLSGFVFTIMIGTLGHFVYQWSGENVILAPFFAVNESTWEHLKLLAVSMLLFSAVEYFSYGKVLSNFLAVRTFCALISMTAIIVVFYGYTAFTRQSYLVADIGIFILAVALSYYLSYFLLKHGLLSGKDWEIAARILLALFAVSFILFTARPPHLFLFQDPVTGQYGM